VRIPTKAITHSEVFDHPAADMGGALAT
jgi:hypothetical protein